MIAFKVNDMYSSRSAGAIVKSMRALDSGARVRVDMQTRSVEIEGSWARPDQCRDAIGKAGFTPVWLQTPEPAPVAQVDLFLPLDD